MPGLHALLIRFPFLLTYRASVRAAPFNHLPALRVQPGLDPESL